MGILRRSLILATILLFTTVRSQASISDHPGTKLDDIPLKKFIALTPHDLFVFTGHRLSLKEKIKFSLFKLSIKKQLKKNPDLTVKEVITHKDEPGALGVIGILLLGIILVGFILFVALFQD
jgi:hypothetical protein